MDKNKKNKDCKSFFPSLSHALSLSLYELVKEKDRHSRAAKVSKRKKRAECVYTLKNRKKTDK